MCTVVATCTHSIRQACFKLLRGRVDAHTVRGYEVLARDQPEGQSQGSFYSLCAWASPPEKKLSFSSVGSSQFFILDLFPSETKCFISPWFGFTNVAMIVDFWTIRLKHGFIFVQSLNFIHRFPSCYQRLLWHRCMTAISAIGRGNKRPKPRQTIFLLTCSILSYH